MSLLDFLDSRVGLALRASGDVDGAIVLVEDLAQLFANACDVVSMLRLFRMRGWSDLPA